jgi:hypothetical protein
MNSALDDFERSLVAASEMLSARQTNPAIGSTDPPRGVGRSSAQQSERPAWRRKTTRVSKRRLQLGTLSATVVAAVAAVVFAVSLSGHAPTAAQAFPVLNGPVRITPSELQASLADYGVSGSGGLDPRHGHPITTPWGTGYVLTPAHPTSATARSEGDLICLVAPGRSPRDWGASCQNQHQATSAGTFIREYAYDTTSRSARLIGLYPRGAVVTAQSPNGARRKVALNDGVLAINITRPIELTVTIDHHTVTSHIVLIDRPDPGVPSGNASPTRTTATTAEAAH